MSGTDASNLDTAFLAGGGELGELMRAKDWSSTPLGAPATWPRSLKTVVRIMLTSSQPIWIGWGPDLLYLYNDAYRSIIGGKHPWALGQPIADIWREIWDDIQPRLRSAMNGDGTFDESQLLIMERNGYPEETYYTFSYCPIPGDDGQPAGIFCANSDETRRVISERQLALLRHVAADAADAKTVNAAVLGATRAMQSNAHDLLFALVFLRAHGTRELRLAGHTVDVSEAWLAYIGAMDALASPWNADEVMRTGQPRLVDELPGEVAWPCGAWKMPARRAMVLPIMPSGDTGQEGVLIVGLNPYRLAGVRYRDFLTLAAQQVTTAISNAQAYELARQRAEELEALDRAKTQFFSNVSHEFRTPLTLMQGPLSDALAEPSLTPLARQHLDMVQRNVLRLSKLVNALLAFSRIEAGRQDSMFRPTDLTAFTQDLASTFRSAMEKAGLRYEVRCEALSQPVYLDREQWERVVLNLLSNALKFTFTGQVDVRLFESQGQAVLEVADTGVGVPREELPRLFERFHRVQGTHGRTHEGSGIGLALVRDIVALHGGHVEARSEPGHGTTFTVRVPLGKGHLPRQRIAQAHGGTHEDQARAMEADAYVREALRWLPEEGVMAGQDGLPSPGSATLQGQGERYRSTWGARIVIADDNADMRQYLLSLLGSYYRVELTANGEEALQAIRRERPALLLSDVMMPRLDGFGLLAAIRKDARLRTLPVVLLSARAGEEATVEGLERGADDYLVKPFTARELLARVAAVIELDRVRRATGEQLRLFLASARMFTWDIDLVTSELSLSPNAAEVLGSLPRDLPEGLSAVHESDRPRLEAALRLAADQRGELQDEIRYIRPDNGETRWLEVRGRVLSEGPQSVRISGIAFDITERKHLEDVLRDSDRRKDEFLAMLAHELRNPMAPIRNAGELMLRLGPQEERMQKAIDVVNRQVAQLTRMVDDLLDVSRVTQGRIALKKEAVSLPAVIAAAIEAMEPMIVERGHTLSVEASQALTVIGDAQRLQQCLVNLLMNATKYTDPGGSLRVVLEQAEDQAIIRVTDSGVGISPDVLPAIFDLFVQSERTLDRAHGGLGIGLSVVKRLIEMHGGSVRAISDGMGQGATFEIRLALADAQAVAASHTAPPARTGTDSAENDAGQLKADVRPPADQHGIASQRVLVVDDNQDAAELLSLVLEAEGHAVKTAFSGTAALDLARQWTPDVVFLDIGLPEMNGYEVARLMRASPDLSGMRLVALTGYGQPADKQRAAEIGFNAHLVKPVAWEDIAQVLGGSH